MPPLRHPAQPAMSGSVPAYAGFETGRPGRAYNEAAFKHFLAVDRRRAERSMGFLLLVLVTLRLPDGRAAKLPEATAAALFRGLGSAIREVDFVGWYREGRVAAAALVQRAGAPPDARHLVAERVVLALKKRLSAGQARQLSVHVVRLGSKARS